MNSKNSIRTYCVVCKNDTENKNPNDFRRINDRIVLVSNCSVCGNEKSRFISKNEGSGLLSSLGIRTPLSEIHLLDVLF